MAKQSLNIWQFVVMIAHEYAAELTAYEDAANMTKDNYKKYQFY